MNIEIEVTKKEKQTIQLETPAYFKSAYGTREVKVMEDEIIEVGKGICVLHLKDNAFGDFYNVINECIEKCDKSTQEAFDTVMAAFINKVYLDPATEIVKEMVKAIHAY